MVWWHVPIIAVLWTTAVAFGLTAYVIEAEAVDRWDLLIAAVCSVLALAAALGSVPLL